ncbi:3-hydroxydecanoyl-(ACP) dehydratase [uncultured Stenotrophomonas sp.]|uniref:3-hydroxydecanoyl-(ACP) dehydratase n=1 Tax=uncultured Stenotrophomonas sp. TaxID=165438 RepID=A0A1Y5Q4J6_9GAMM|nr:3-hydroxydecanoyl-(ACP) dehydratase [uncultured Stenotrophomonas sp.]
MKDMHHYDIDAVVPHRAPMRLIDRLLDWDEDSVAVEVVVPADGLFSEADGVPAWVGVEYMAQAIAAWAGCRARQAGQAPSLGFLLGTRRYVAERPYFRSGARLRVEARCELLGENGLGMFACRIMEGEDVVAVANVSVFEPGDALAYLESGQV